MIDSKLLFPHKTLSDLSLRVSDVTVVFSSGRRLSIKSRPAVTSDAHSFNLFADEDLNGWQSLQVAVRVVSQTESTKSLVPRGSDLQDNAAMVVSVHCISTRLRRRVFLTKDADRDGEWYGQIDVAADDVRDALELAPILARSTRYPESATDDDGSALATYQGAILAYGDAVRFQFDEPKEGRNGSFKVTWDSFNASANSWLRSHPTDLFFIDTSEAAPQVILNSDHDLLKQTLMKKRPRGAEQTIKASIIAYIAHATWLTLFLTAIADSAANDGEPEWPNDSVKARVLRRLLPMVIPERTDDDARLEEAVEQYRDPSRFSELLTKLHSAIQGMMRLDNFVVRTLEGISVGEEP